jgi:hypothetical protein
MIKLQMSKSFDTHVPHATHFYGKFENANFDFFAKKRFSRIKTALTLAYGFEKKCVIYKNISTEKLTSKFNCHRLFAQILASQNSNGKYERRKSLHFVRKNEKIDFF